MDLFFELMNRAGSVNGLDGPAVRADKIITMFTRYDKGKVGGTFVKPKSPQNALVVQAL